MRVKSWRIGVSSFFVTLLLIAFARLTATALQPQQIAFKPPAPTSTILVAAAVSLQKSLQEITPLYTKANPTQTINYNFGSSGVLGDSRKRIYPLSWAN